jgi:transposase-like protein
MAQRSSPRNEVIASFPKSTVPQAYCCRRRGAGPQRGHPLSLRNLEEMMAERGVFVDHATVGR